MENTMRNTIANQIFEELESIHKSEFNKKMKETSKSVIDLANKHNIECKELTGQNITWDSYLDQILKTKAIQLAEKTFAEIKNIGVSTPEDLLQYLPELMEEHNSSKLSTALIKKLKLEQVKELLTFANTKISATKISTKEFDETEKSIYAENLHEDFHILKNTQINDFKLLLETKNRIINTLRLESVTKNYLHLDFSEIKVEELLIQRANKIGTNAANYLKHTLRKIITSQKTTKEALYIKEYLMFIENLTNMNEIILFFSELNNQPEMVIAKNKFQFSEFFIEQLFKAANNELFPKSA